MMFSLSRDRSSNLWTGVLSAELEIGSGQAEPLVPGIRDQAATVQQDALAVNPHDCLLGGPSDDLDDTELAAELSNPAIEGG
jgi:hypothetical protein